MSASPYVPFYTSDFLGGTSGMTAASKGVYITLICLIYEAEAPLPQSWDTLARRCGCTLPAFKRAVEALQDDGKIEVTGAGIWSEKCAKHIAQRRERQGSAKAAAKTRWEKIKENQSHTDKAALKPQCQPEPEPDIIPNGIIAPDENQQNSKPRKRRPELPLPDGWIPDIEKARRVMEEYKLTRDEMNFCYKAMEAHAHANDRRQRDWDAAYRNWVVREIGYGNIGPNSKQRKQSAGQSSIWD